MNRFLAESLGVANAIVAVLVIVFWTTVGGLVAWYGTALYMPNVLPGSNVLAGMVAGSFLGFLCAILTCGVLALFVAMHEELKAMRKVISGEGVRRIAPVWATPPAP
jgi:uncharacterized membrane protein YraQ (UPF0718 family)